MFLHNKILIYIRNTYAKYMKYLKTRQDFLSEIISYKESYVYNSKDINGSILVNEVFANDITWGGSLLGRLINSTIRSAKIVAKKMRVNGLLKKLEEQLGVLLESGLSDDKKKELNKLRIRALLSELIKAVNESVPGEIDPKFIGDEDNIGLIDHTIKLVEKEEDFEDKETIIKKLKKFKSDLEELLKSGHKIAEVEEEIKKESEPEDEGDSSYNEKFFNETVNMLKSIVGIYNSIKKESEPKKEEIISLKKSDLKVGGIYNYKNDKGETKKVKLLSLDHQLGFGKDHKFLTKDDEVKGELDEDLVFVQYLLKDATKVTTGAVKVSALSKDTKTETTTVDPVVKPKPIVKPEPITVESLKFSLILESDHTKNAYNKILKYYKLSNIEKYINSIKLISEESDKESIKFEWCGIIWPLEGDYKKKIEYLGKQILANTSTVGKPMDHNMLILESNSFSDVSKSISIFCVPILGFKDDIKVSESLPIDNEIKTIVESFDKLKEFLPKLLKKKEEKPKDREDSEEKTESKFYMRKFSLINEADNDYEEGDDVDDDIEDGDDENKVKKAWRDNFSEEEEKKWAMTEEEYRKKEEEWKNEKSNIDSTGDGKDPIVRISNIFGGAYKLFATKVIPSGRPNGRISQKTYREYKYVGKGTPGSPDGDNGPGYGPWINMTIFNKWESGVTTLLENVEYRKFLADPKFTLNGNVGAGQSLFKFIMDMLEDDTLDKYDSARRRLLEKYFNISDAKSYKRTEYDDPYDKKLPPDDRGGDGESVWSNYPWEANPTDAKLKRTFVLIDCKIGGADRKFIAFILGIKDNKFIFKFQAPEANASELLSYLPKDIKRPKDKIMSGMDGNNKKVYIGYIDMPMKKSEKLTVKYKKVEEFKDDSEFKNMAIDINKSYILCVNKNERLSKVSIKNINTRPSKDISIKFDEIIDKIK